jgi:hypothetical protein
LSFDSIAWAFFFRLIRVVGSATVADVYDLGASEYQAMHVKPVWKSEKHLVYCEVAMGFTMVA